MDGFMSLALIAAISLAGYLLMALLKPECFS